MIRFATRVLFRFGCAFAFGLTLYFCKQCIALGFYRARRGVDYRYRRKGEYNRYRLKYLERRQLYFDDCSEGATINTSTDSAGNVYPIPKRCKPWPR